MAATATIGRIAVSFTANTASFLMQVKNAEKKVATSSKKMGDSTQKFSMKAKVGLAAVGVALVQVGKFAIQASVQFNETNKHLRQLGETAGLTAEQMRRQAYAFRETGLGAEQMAEIFKDVKDKVGEFASLGTGVWEDFHKTLGKTRAEGMAMAQQLQHMSGPQVLQFLVREMDKANVSGAQMTFVMESVANNSSRMISALREQSEQVNKLSEEYDKLAQSASPEAHKAMENAFSSWTLFSDSLGAVTLEVMRPIWEGFDSMIKTLTDMLPDTNQTQSNRRMKQIEGDALNDTAGISDQTERMYTVVNEFLNEKVKLQDAIKLIEMDIMKMTRNGPTKMRAIASGALGAYEDNLELNKKMLSDLEGMIQSYETKLKQMVAGEIAIKEKLGKELNKIAIDTGVDLNASLSDQHDKRLQILEAKQAQEIKDFEDKYKALFEGQLNYEMASTRLQLKHNSQKLAENKRYTDAIIAEEKRVNAELDKIKKEQQETTRMSYELFAMIHSENSKAKLDAEMEMELLALENTYAGKQELTELYEQAIDSIKEKYAEKEKERIKSIARLQAEKDMEKAQGYTDMFGAMGDAAAVFASQSETMGKVAFGLQKGAALSQALINAHLAVTEAWADPALPWYSKAAVAAGSFASVMGAMMAIKGVNYGGQAHGGMDEIPTSLNNSSFVLKAGERVVQPEANKDLTNFLKDPQSNGGGTTHIDASIHIKGNVTDEAWFNQQLVKQRETIAASVRRVEKERPLSRRR